MKMDYVYSTIFQNINVTRVIINTIEPSTWPIWHRRRFSPIRLKDFLCSIFIIIMKLYNRYPIKSNTHNIRIISFCTVYGSLNYFVIDIQL